MMKDWTNYVVAVGVGAVVGAGIFLLMDISQWRGEADGFSEACVEMGGVPVVGVANTRVCLNQTSMLGIVE